VKTFVLGFVNSYTPLFFAAFIDQNFLTLNFTLAIILIFKQVIFALIANISPMISYPKKFKKLDQIIDDHILKYRNEYEKPEFKLIHKSCEHQISLKEIPQMQVALYNNIAIQIGWLTYFGPAFVAAPFFSLISTVINVATTLKDFNEYSRRSQP